MQPTPNKHIFRLEPYVGGKSKIQGVERVIKLSSNENPYGPSPKALEAYRNSALNILRYPDPSQKIFRQAIASSLGLDERQIVGTVGSDEAIALLINGYGTVGDEIIHTDHGFLMYKIYATAFGLNAVSVKETELRTDVDAILAAVTEKTRLVFIANPNNPTGSYIGKSEVRRLRNGLPENIILVLDGAYAEYVTEQDYTTGKELVESTNNTVMLRTFSKVHGLSALRIGYAYCPPDIADVLNRLRAPFNISTPAMLAAAASIQDAAYLNQVISKTNGERSRMAQEISAMGIKVHPSSANFLLLDFSNFKITATEMNTRLMASGIIVREVANYGLPSHLRITIGTEEENDMVLGCLRG
jgi:histidinol-phosphate aminotransferase